MHEGRHKEFDVQYYDPDYTVGLKIREENIMDFKSHPEMLNPRSDKGFNGGVEEALADSGEYFNLTSANG